MRITEGKLIGTGLNIAIIASRSGGVAVSQLIDNAKDILMRHDVSGSAIDIYRVPGVWELPVIAQEAALTGKYDAIIALGAELTGELLPTLATVALNHRVPVLFGSDGADCAMRAIETANLLRNIRRQNTTNTTEERIINA